MLREQTSVADQKKSAKTTRQMRCVKCTAETARLVPYSKSKFRSRKIELTDKDYYDTIVIAYDRVKIQTLAYLYLQAVEILVLDTCLLYNQNHLHHVNILLILFWSSLLLIQIIGRQCRNQDTLLPTLCRQKSILMLFNIHSPLLNMVTRNLFIS